MKISITPQEEQQEWIKQLESIRRRDRPCSLHEPLMLVIPPEGIIISCPSHPQGHFIRPSAIITC